MRLRPVSAALAMGAVGIAAVLVLADSESTSTVPPSAPPTVQLETTASNSCVKPIAPRGSDPPPGGKPARFYHGPSASPTYDAQFRRSFPIPHLDTHVPQGMTTWRNWDGKGATLLVVGYYRGEDQDGEQSLLAAVDPRTGRHYGTVRVRPSHLGGIAVLGDYLFAHDSGAKGLENVRRYRLSSLAKAFAESHRSGERPFVGMLKDRQAIYGADFMTVHDGRLWAGPYTEAASDLMYEYEADSKGKLAATGAGWPIPPRVQGALVTDKTFVFNSFNHHQPGVLVLSERSRSESRRTVCFATPSRGEGMSLAEDRAFVVYEGAAYRFPKTVNRVGDFHEASLSSLERLLRD